MKYCMLLFAFLSITSCKENDINCKIKISKERLDEKDLECKIIDLIDTLGSIYVEFPYQFNGYLEWYNYSDCSCCGYQSYRLADTNFKPVMEAGWLKSSIPDSMYQITFYHSPYECPDIPIEAQDSIHKLIWHRGPEYIRQAGFEMIFTKYEVINHLEWIIYAYYMPSYQLNRSPVFPQIYTLEALTAIGNKLLHFKAECQTANCEGFIEKMKEVIHSTRYFSENCKIEIVNTKK